jgi:ribonucleoside-diphosphate reductase alpha chain
MPRRKKRSKKVRKRISLDELKLPSYEEIKADIEKKIGKQPSFPKTLPKGSWTEQSLQVLKERYLRKDSEGKVIETPDEMCWRVAWEMASAEARWGRDRKEVKKTAKEFYALLSSHQFLPNSPTLMNAGTNNDLQYSGCYVVPVEDSLDKIFEAIKYQALIHKSGGGTGFSFSRLRPRGSIVKSSNGIASGPVSFMRVFDAATNEVKQGGKRRGANMGILRVDHPDILEFIHCKEEGGITNFNISVAITDKFMKAYENDGEYDLIDTKTGKKSGSLSARKVFDEIAEGAWRIGDPGLVFIDRINKSTANPVPELGPVESTNPCGEQPLYPFDSCNLGSIFLTYLVKEEKGEKKVDWERLKEVTQLSVRFLDDVIEMNPYPLEQIKRTSWGIRRIGLGVGGWADMLIELGIPYDSDEAFDLAEKVMRTIQQEAVKASQELAKERGAFPMWPKSIYKNNKPRRNSTVTTIAPTGTISIIAGASSGIEPLFAIAFQHVVKDKHLDRTLAFFAPKFEEMAKTRGFWTDKIKEKVAEYGTARDIEEVPEDVREIFGTAHEIHHDWHIKMQSVFQKYTENAVSKTINMRNEVTVNDIKEAYLLAWKTDCKGITVFRDGCKSAQVLNLGIKEGKKQEDKVYKEAAIVRPFRAIGATYKLNTPVGTAFITINQDEGGEPLELFVNVGKAGSDVTAMAEALGRTISIALRFRGDLKPKERAKEIALQLAGIGGRRSVGFGPNKILSLPDAVAAALSNHFGFGVNGFTKELGRSLVDTTTNGEMSNGDGLFVTGAKPDSAGATLSADNPEFSGKANSGISDHTAASAESGLASAEQLILEAPGDICPSCGASSFVYQEGCAKCYSCGHSEC